MTRRLLAIFALAALTGCGTAPKPAAIVAAQTIQARQGVVTVSVTVAAGGAVTDVRLIREDPAGYGFGAAAVKAIRAWEFKTAQPGQHTVTVTLKLN